MKPRQVLIAGQVRSLAHDTRLQIIGVPLELLGHVQKLGHGRIGLITYTGGKPPNLGSFQTEILSGDVHSII